MWELVNRTSFAAERTFARDRNGAEVFLVAVKGTFVLGSDGMLARADVQEPVLPAPVYSGEPGTSSLLYETDLVLGKPATDVLVHGHAYALSGKAAPAVEVSLRVGPIFKRIVAVGDRTWEKRLAGLTLSDPAPFERMPLVYERAFGGSIPAGAGPRVEREARNPVGTGLVLSASEAAGKRAPNLEHPGDVLHTWDQRPRPAGLGPIARDWSPRVELAGTYDAQWERDRMPLPPLDFDDRFYQCAPEDQQVPGYLRGGEAVELRGMTPGGLLRFTLPRVDLGFTTSIGGEKRGHEANLHTVIIEPDQLRVILVWHTAMPCHHSLYTLRRTVVFEKGGAPA